MALLVKWSQYRILNHTENTIWDRQKAVKIVKVSQFQVGLIARFYCSYTTYFIQGFGVSKPSSRKFSRSISHCLHTTDAHHFEFKMVGISSLKAI